MKKPGIRSTAASSLLLAAALSGCVYPPAKDDRTGEELLGPIAMGIKRQAVLGSCRQVFMHSGTCDLIFTDSRGFRVDGHRLAQTLDQTAKQIPPLSRWLSRSLDDESKLPYELHLLTISPAVVLAVPATSQRLRCSSVYAQGCIQSQGFRSQAYWYRAAPTIRPGSFWYVAGSDAPQPVEVNSGKVTITSTGVELELSADGGSWLVRRIK